MSCRLCSGVVFDSLGQSSHHNKISICDVSDRYSRQYIEPCDMYIIKYNWDFFCMMASFISLIAFLLSYHQWVLSHLPPPPPVTSMTKNLILSPLFFQHLPEIDFGTQPLWHVLGDDYRWLVFLNCCQKRETLIVPIQSST